MEIKAHQHHFEKAFQNYLSFFDTLVELTDQVLDKNIRLFDIRFRLALSLQVSFDSSISYTKTESTRKTYALIFKLNELWFAYEGIYKLCEENALLKSNATKSDPFKIETVQELELEAQLALFNDYLEKHFYSNTRLLKDSIEYVRYLKINATSNTQVRLLENLKNKLSIQKDLVLPEILALIYGIRNLYVHQTDTAKSGVRQYKTKIELLKMSIDFLTLSLLQIANFLLDKEVKTLE